MDSFLTPAAVFESDLTVKRSRFIAACAPVEGKGQGKAFIELRAQVCPDAGHHCWAMVAGVPQDVYQHDQSDDGEPRGSAGKPMLNVLTHSGMGQIVVVVSRIFGGTKLGVGGLVRAYSQAVVDVLDIAQTRRVYSRSQIDVVLPYSLLDRLEHKLPSMNCEIVNRNFGSEVELSILVPSGEEDAFHAFITDLGSGLIVLSNAQ